MRFTLVRDYEVDCTDGELFDATGKHLAWTIELPWKENKHQISCIPEGEYKYHKKFSQHLGWVLELEKVPDRSLIYMHSGNTVLDLLGCIAPGSKQGTLNVKGRIYPAVLNSKDTMKKILDIAGTSGTITITKR